MHRLGGGEVGAAENGGALEAAWHARRSLGGARRRRRRGRRQTRRRRAASLAGSRAAAMAARPLARMVETGSWPRRSACGGGDARFPDRYASSKAARAASKRPDATAAALVSARRIAATQAPRVTDGEFERDAHKTPSNASERICVASPVSSPVRRSLKEATQPETLLASPPRIHAHSSTARGDAFARITAAATRTASRVTFATSRDCKACCFTARRPHANSTNVQLDGGHGAALRARRSPRRRGLKNIRAHDGGDVPQPLGEVFSARRARALVVVGVHLVVAHESALGVAAVRRRRAVLRELSAAPPPPPPPGDGRAHATSSSAGGPTRPPHALWDSNAAAISVHGCSAAAGDAPGASPAMASHSASRQKHRTSASAPASGGGFEPSAAARRSSLLSDRFFAFLSFENSLVRDVRASRRGVRARAERVRRRVLGTRRGREGGATRDAGQNLGAERGVRGRRPTR